MSKTERLLKIASEKSVIRAKDVEVLGIIVSISNVFVNRVC